MNNADVKLKLKEKEKEIEKLQKQLQKERLDFDSAIKLLTRKDVKLVITQQELEKKILDLERAKEEQMILRIRELAKARDIENKTAQLEKLKESLLSALADLNKARKEEEKEKNKTLAIIQNFVDGIFVLDNDNRVLLVNPQAERFLDVNGNDLIGKDFLELSHLPTLNLILNAIGKEIKDIFRKEVKIKENLILEITIAPVMLKEERFGSLIILHDITREKLLEKMKSEFVSIAAHQLRTPLSGIKWGLRIILDGEEGELRKEQKEILERIYQTNERLINLINDLLNVARIEEGRYVYKMSYVDIVSLCMSQIESLKNEIDKRDIKLDVEIKTRIPKTMVDIEKMNLVFQNLLENAVKYNKRGGKILVKFEIEKDNVKVTISDTGIGIPEKQKDKVFTKFFRSENAIKMETEGSGLGLFIVKNIIEGHGGKIWFESKEGEGTTFYFTLPIYSQSDFLEM